MIEFTSEASCAWSFCAWVEVVIFIMNLILVSYIFCHTYLYPSRNFFISPSCENFWHKFMVLILMLSMFVRSLVKSISFSVLIICVSSLFSPDQPRWRFINKVYWSFHKPALSIIFSLSLSLSVWSRFSLVDFFYLLFLFIFFVLIFRTLSFSSLKWNLVHWFDLFYFLIKSLKL